MSYLTESQTFYLLIELVGVRLTVLEMLSHLTRVSKIVVRLCQSGRVEPPPDKAVDLTSSLRSSKSHSEGQTQVRMRS